MRKLPLITILMMFILISNAFADQTLSLKQGFNFHSLTTSPTITPTTLKQQYSELEEIYLYSAASGSFLNTTDGTLSTIAAGKGYIFKTSSQISINIPGNSVTTIGDINLKPGFNLIGFSKMPETITFSSLMSKNSIIKGIYKWSPASGTFIQVLRNSGVVQQIDNTDPQLKSGESYFINVYSDTKLNYDNSNLIFTPSTPPSTTVVTSPIFNPTTGIYTSTQSVTLTSATADAIIKYTTDGTIPSAANGITYTGPITVPTSMTIKAIAIKSGMTDSDLAIAAYTINISQQNVSKPTFSPEGGTFSSATQVTITCATSGAIIKYTVDGTTPSAAVGQTYTAPISISSTTSLKAVAIKSGLFDSDVASATYTINNNGQTLSLDLGDGVKLEMVKIPAGTFQMGSPDNEEGRQQFYNDSESPLHTVSISKEFYMSKFEITQAQWIKICGSWSFSSASGFGDNYPAYNVSWDDICADGGFLDKINALRPNGYIGFRLPTEAEWEYACRANTQTRFYWGDDLNYTSINNYAWTSTNSGMTTNMVGKKLPNAFGLYDMCGNVMEWCTDLPRTYSSSTIIDPVGFASTINRVYRGGSWNETNSWFRSANRFYQSYDARLNYAGLRLVLVINQNGKVATPVISPSTGSFTITQYEALTCSTPGAKIRYTKDGSIPSATNGTTYYPKISLGGSTTSVLLNINIKAIATFYGMADSDLSAASYSIKPTIAKPVISPAGGTFMTNSKIVTITCSTSDTFIYYTTDGTTPNANKTLYTSPINVTSATVIKAIAIKTGGESEITQTNFTLVTPPSGNILSLDIGNGLKIEMIRIPAGTFQMGQLDVITPVHTVTISKAFYMSKYEITQAQWMKICGSWPNIEPSATYGIGDNYPAYYISWNDISSAGGFIDKINNLKPGGYIGYRLPTEAEWEYACRAGTQTLYYWGDSLLPTINNYEWTRYNSPSPSTAQSVGQKLPNPFGLYDMGGNVQEFCGDAHQQYTAASVTDPFVQPTSQSFVVIRGGDWTDFESKSAIRSFGKSTDKSYMIGFRLVLPSEN